MPEKETYQITAECENCGHIPKKKAPDGKVICPLEYEIPKGTPTVTFLMYEVCPNCGCRGTLRRRF